MDKEFSFTVRDLPKPERPRERLQKLGPDALSFLNKDMHRVVEPGLFDVMVGGNSVDLTKTVLEVVGR